MASEAENKPEVPEEQYGASRIEGVADRLKEEFGQMDKLSVAGGVALAVGFLAISQPIDQSNSFGVLSIRISPVFVTLYVALSTGHYLGRAVTGSDSNFVDGIFGIFLVFALGVIGWSVVIGMPSLSVALLGIILGLVMAHHRGWVNESEWVNLLMKVYGKGIVPLGMVGAVVVKLLLPIMHDTAIPGILHSLGPIELTALVLITLGIIWVTGKAVESLDNSSEKNRRKT